MQTYLHVLDMLDIKFRIGLQILAPANKYRTIDNTKLKIGKWWLCGLKKAASLGPTIQFNPLAPSAHQLNGERAFSIWTPVRRSAAHISQQSIDRAQPV